MRWISVVLSLLAVGGLSVILAGCGRDSRITTGPSPKIMFEKNAYDFGEVGINTKRTDQIEFKNTGDAVLKITKVEGCCGVTVDLDKTEFAPGETGVLKMEWTTKPHPATMWWQMIVHSNDRANPKVPLAMKAELVHRIAWNPPRLRLFLEEENAGCPKLTIRSLDRRPFSIKGLKSTANCITADYDPSAEATEFVLEPKVDIRKLEQNLQGRVSFDLSHPEGREITVLFDVLPKYSISPQLLILYGAAPGKAMVRKIKVSSYLGDVPDVESVTAKDDAFTVKVLGQEIASNGRELEVEITPTTPAVVGKTLYPGTFYIKLKSGEELSITCNAYYTAVKPRTEAR